MTDLEKPVTRRVRTRDGVELVVTLSLEGIYTREAGKRTGYGPVPYSWVHSRGARLEGDRQAEERGLRRNVRRSVL